MTKVINLIGASGAGKTTIAKELEEKGYNIIQSYTTREPRSSDEWGHRFIDDYFWCHGNIYNYEGETINSRDMIAYEELYDNHYFATDEQVERGKTNIYVVTPNGAEQVKEYYKANRRRIEVINVYLAADEEVRRNRTEKRYMADNDLNKFNLSEILDTQNKEAISQIRELRAFSEDRIKRDKDIFKVIAADYVIDANREIEEVLNDVVEIIR